MKEPITLERWQQAQVGEKIHHVAEPVEMSYEHYKKAYGYYFEYLDICPDLQGKKVIEIGPGRIAALLFCINHGSSVVLEPTKYDGIDHLYEIPNLKIVNELAEEWDFPQVDEIWLLNLLQHVKDPDKLIAKCKASAKVIRFFEPVDLPTNLEHPFTFSMEDFKGYFGADVVKDYPANQNIKGFHGANCAYGVWYNPKKY